MKSSTFSLSVFLPRAKSSKGVDNSCSGEEVVLRRQEFNDISVEQKNEETTIVLIGKEDIRRYPPSVAECVKPRVGRKQGTAEGERRCISSYNNTFTTYSKS